MKIFSKTKWKTSKHDAGMNTVLAEQRLLGMSHFSRRIQKPIDTKGQNICQGVMKTLRT
jgi:hypothetical protein